jgi:hypothetical protein
MVCSICNEPLYRAPSEQRRSKRVFCSVCYLQHRVKYTPELLGPLAATSVSVSEIVRKLGLRPHGGTHNYIKLVLKKFGIDTSHFLGFSWAKGKSFGPSFRRQSARVILVLRPEGSRRQPAYKLKRALLEIGRPYKCEKCNIDGIWNGEPLNLQIDHRNGIIHDDQRENLRFMCANCHSQTSNFGSKNAGSIKPS